MTNTTNKKQSIIVGTAASASLVGVIAVLLLSQSVTTFDDIEYLNLTILPEPQTANAIPIENPSCLPSTIESALASSESTDVASIKTPHTLPVGYSLRAVDHAERGWTTLFYFDESMCPFEFSPRDYALKGTISITSYYNEPTATKLVASAFVDQILNDPDNQRYAKWGPITLGGNLAGNPAVATEAYIGASLTYLNDELIEEKPLPMPAMVYFVDEKTGIEYRIVGNMPLDDLITVAESIR